MKTLKVVLMIVMTMALIGCTPEPEHGEGPKAPPPPILRDEQVEDTVILVLDTSGSFAEFMTSDGKAWTLVTRIVDEMFRSRLGRNDQLLIAQVSGNKMPLLWQGKPQQIRGAFANAADFRSFLINKSSMSGSRVYDGISDAMEYCLNDPRLRKSNRLAMLVCSDMEDTAPDSDKAEERLVTNLKDFGKHGGVVGMYWVSVHPDRVTPWRRNLERAGVKGVVEGSITHQPQLPKWD